MKIILVFFILHFQTTYSQENGYYSTKNLNTLGYKISNNKYPILNDSKVWYNYLALSHNRNRAVLLDTIDVSKIKKTNNSFFKCSIKPKGRCNIYVWEFKTEIEAINTENIINRNNKKIFEDEFCKYPWTIWRHQNKIFSIIMGGWWCIDDMPKIKKSIMFEIEDKQ